MRVRKSARLLILNHKNEILLSKYEGVKINEPGQKPLDAYWETLGGGIDEGETIHEAALREAYEEAGITPDQLHVGDVVWWGENHLIVRGDQDMLAQHSFILARLTVELDADKLVPQGLTEDELGYLKGFKWWSVDELLETDEHIVPPILPEEIDKIIKGDVPSSPKTLKLSFS